MIDDLEQNFEDYDTAAIIADEDFTDGGEQDFAKVEDYGGQRYGQIGEMYVPIGATPIVEDPQPLPMPQEPESNLGKLETFINAPFSGLARGIASFVGNTAAGLRLIDQKDVDAFFKSMDKMSGEATKGNPAALVLDKGGALVGQYVAPAVTGFNALRALGVGRVASSIIAESMVGFFGISPNDETIFNNISEDTDSPAFKTLRDFLATDPNDNEYVNRAKHAADALIMLGGSEAVVRGFISAAKGTKEFLKTPQGQEVLEFAEQAGSQADARLAESMGGSKLSVNPIGAAGDMAVSAAGKLAARARVGTTGQYIGAPPGVTTPQKLGALRKRLTSLAKEGAEGRMWYERSSAQILDAVNGDVDEADKIIQAIAVTSPGTPVKNNLDFALQAYSQWKAGEPIRTGRFPTAMSKKLEQIFEGDQWAGRKTDDFYNNLMIHIDPSRTGPVTGDIWMLRAFGFTKPNEMPSPRQYEFITQETQQIAQQLGWEPHQVQAAIWVTMKGRAENPAVKKATEALSEKKGWIKFVTNERTGKRERVVIDQQNHMKNWLNHAMRHNLTDADIDRAKFDYADALADNRGQISWESIPGQTSSHMPEMFTAPYEQQAEYHVALSKAFLDENGDDIIAKRLGVLSPGDFEAPGFFEGKVSPSTQTIALMPRQFKSVGTGEVEQSAQDLISAYAAVRGILMKQDGVGWHRPFYKAKKRDENGIMLRIGRPFSEAETKRLGDILADLAGHGEYNPVAAEDGVRLINFDFARKVPDGEGGFKPAMDSTWIDEDKLLTNEEFGNLVDEAISRLELDDDLVVDPGEFHAYTGYSGNDWSVNQNGESYTAAITGQGRSDLQGRVRDLINELQPRIDEIDRGFSERYGWTINDAINATYRGADDVTSQPLN